MDGSGWVQERGQRDRSGRFVSGVSGNPAGKRRGTLNRMTRLKLALSVDESGAVARAVIDRALAGDRIALRLCFEAILPKARSRPIELDLPVCDSIENVAAAFDVTVAAMAAGEITPDEALKVTRVLDRRRRALTARAARVAAEEPAETAATAAAPVAAASEPAGADLHSTCNNRDSAMLGAAAGTVDATIKAAGPPLPELGSSCILPAISGAASRRAGPIEPGSAVMDDL
ncbi:MAG: hypothetical protein JWL84_4652, partial [Rhodospirillales bacterium]|nr:hypothetical protein [Rhodospirillales bacterium]